MSIPREYLIRTAARGLPAMPSRFEDVLVPATGGWQPIDGWGDFRIGNGVAHVDFSYEEVGWQISVEGPLGDEVCLVLIDALTQQIGAACGEPCIWSRLT
jgi:hypothetical protein